MRNPLAAAVQITLRSECARSAAQKQLNSFSSGVVMLTASEFEIIVSWTTFSSLFLRHSTHTPLVPWPLQQYLQFPGFTRGDVTSRCCGSDFISLPWPIQGASSPGCPSAAPHESPYASRLTHFGLTSLLNAVRGHWSSAAYIGDRCTRKSRRILAPKEYSETVPT